MALIWSLILDRTGVVVALEEPMAGEAEVEPWVKGARGRVGVRPRLAVEGTVDLAVGVAVARVGVEAVGVREEVEVGARREGVELEEVDGMTRGRGDGRGSEDVVPGTAGRGRFGVDEEEEEDMAGLEGSKARETTGS